MEIKELIYDETQIENLYKENNWTSYTNNPKRLFQGIKNSLFSLGAYHNQSLIGLARVVGDGQTIVYIQDLLVLKEYQNKGIGKELLKNIISRYSEVRQIVLMTDNTFQLKRFYEKNGFVQIGEQNLVSFIYRRTK